MSNILFQNLFISVGIDVGADFSFMSIALPNRTFVGKPFKILHSDLISLSMAVSKIKEAEEMYSLESHIFLESTGIYHFPLFCYLRDKGFLVSIINPIITKNSTNINIRKVHNDKFDSKKAALIGLNPDLKVSLIPSDLVLDLRNLSREYYDLMDNRSAYVNKLQGELRMVFPQFLKIFSKITVNIALTLLEKYTSPDKFLSASKDEIVASIRSTARFGITYSEKKYNAIIKAANEAKVFGYSVNSNFKRILLYIRFIRQYDAEIQAILSDMHELVNCSEDTDVVTQIHLIESFKGAGFLSAVSLMCEIGDFSAFQSPKQLFAYFGLDPAVKQSGNFEGTKISMSKRGSRIARMVLHTMALISISRNKDGSAKNPVLRDYYLKKCQSKPKMVALGAVMHKVCNIVFAILRDEKKFEIITPEEHQKNYLKARCDIAL
ncbi:IS110 family transposase [Sporanaerobacter sp. PP17-6a]|uniref:IS110 family transposase n=1 Tax=Sporanaerobacter sp. PP17-6a TaxID=1891289 RepID=UPI0008A05733|nr:IS110 family transposase [Sporanaerobacter sp. PP17-6a]SCL97246.1 Transposase IS116/IS110/IS902 family protein [Sporanaerobacter sp. PP17-6a]